MLLALDVASPPFGLESVSQDISTIKGRTANTRCSRCSTIRKDYEFKLELKT